MSQQTVETSLLAMLHLSSATSISPENPLSDKPPLHINKPPLSATTTTPRKSRKSKCAYSSSLQEPVSKRLATISSIAGYTKLPLQEITTPSPLYRTFSDPTGSVGTSHTPPHDPIKRTVSWPPNFQEFHTPPHNPIKRTASCSPNIQEFHTPPNSFSPNAVQQYSPKKLEGIKAGIRKISQWCEQVIQQDDDQEEIPSEETNVLKDDEIETETEPPSEESVWVERLGECVILHFKCPCGSGYEILLHGDNCYYKLA